MIEFGKQRPGRKCKLKPKDFKLMEELLKEGHYNDDVRAALGISTRTWYNYYNSGKEIDENMEILGVEIPEEDLYAKRYLLRFHEEYGLGEEDWLHLQMYHTVERANNYAKMEALRNIRKAGKKSWQAEAWFLERKFRQQFGRVTVVDNTQQDGDSTEQGKLRELVKGIDTIAQTETPDSPDE